MSMHDSFQHTYRCSKSDRENGDKILLPSSALSRLITMMVDYPMLFQLTNPSTGQISHCGVLEFTSQEGFVLMPDWMMQNMKLLEGETVVVKNVSVSKGTYMKLQPHSTDFINLTSPKSVLETTLRSFTCLTTGDTIMILHNNRKYLIDVVETKPSSAICVIETDCEVDFAPPLDYKEPEKPVKKEEEEDDDNGDEAVKKKKRKGLEENKFKAFTGIARRLDVCSSIIKNGSDEQIVEANNVKNKSSTDQSNLKVPMSRKLVFNSNGAGKEEAKSANNGQEKFQAFTGRSYKLN